MQIRLKPWTENERFYFYRQSQQLSGQTVQIGKLRADFDREGTGFFSTLEDIRPDLKTVDFPIKNQALQEEQRRRNIQRKRYSERFFA